MAQNITKFEHNESTMQGLLATAREIRAREECDPIMMIVGKEKTVMANLGPWWGDHNERCVLMAQLGGMVGFGLDAQVLYIVVEAWMASYDTVGLTEEEALEKHKSEPLPSENPNRSEVIMVEEILKTGEQHAIMQQFKHADPNNNDIIWEEPKMMTDHRDFTFKYFFEGLKKSEAIIDSILDIGKLTHGTKFKDSGKTAIEHARAGAIKAAMAKWGFSLVQSKRGEKGDASRN